MARRVLIIHGAERLRAHEGAARILKVLEEPAPLSHMILITDHPAELLDTIRSRCLPVPFRGLGWRAAREHMSPFETEMRQIGVDLALDALTGGGEGTPSSRIAAIQARMEEVAGRNESEQLAALRARGGRAGGKARRAHGAEARRGPREARAPPPGDRRLDLRARLRRPTPAPTRWPWRSGPRGTVRHTERLDALRAVGTPERRPVPGARHRGVPALAGRAGPQPARGAGSGGAAGAPGRGPPRRPPAAGRPRARVHVGRSAPQERAPGRRAQA